MPLLMRWLEPHRLAHPDPGRLVLGGVGRRPAVGVRYRHLGHDPAPIGLVAALRESSVLFAVLLSWGWLGSGWGGSGWWPPW